MTLNFTNVGLVSPNNVLYTSFNQDAACFSVGTTKGFCIYNCDPFKETYRRSFPGGGIGIVEMMWRSNILALVGGGAQPCFPKTHVMIWDDNQISCIGELRFATEVRAVKLRRDLKVLVALDNSVHVYAFHPLDVECVLETGDNPTGMLVVCPTAHVVVATLAKSQLGVASLHNLSTDKGFLVTCHETPIMCMALSNDGALLATASERGTLIRVYDTATTEKVKEVRRGSQNANIYSLAFSPDQRFLACGSDTGTVHVFALKGGEGSEGGQNSKGAFGFMSGVSSYFASEWSFAKYNSAQIQGKAVIVTFSSSEPGKIFCVTSDCSFLCLRFDTMGASGGTMTPEKIVGFPNGE